MSKESLEKQLEKQNAFKERKRKEAEEEKKEKQRRREEKERERIEKWEEEGSDEFIKETFPKKTAKNLQTLSVPTVKKHMFKSLYLTGDVGSGKTLYAAKLALKMKDYYYRNNEKFTVKFIKFPMLLMLYRESYNSDKEYDGNFELNTEKKIYDYYTRVDLLILDDLGIVKQSDWVLEKLYNVIDKRNEEQVDGKQTIITSNLSLDEIEEVTDWNKRNASRIYEMCKVVNFGSKDLRKDK